MIIFKSIVGSQMYGTNIPTSDTDIKGVYIKRLDQLLSFDLTDQLDINKDETYFELSKFIKLLGSANPTVLELLWAPERCILDKNPIFDLILEHKHHFLTKKCMLSFSGYALAQIEKAKGLNKKMNWEQSRVERKGPEDFTYLSIGGRSISFKKWLESNGLKANDKRLGLIELKSIKDGYALYRLNDPIISGVYSEDGNDVKLSSINEYTQSEPICTLFFNKDSYSRHCKDWRQYQEWLANRNTQRYVDVANHQQSYDGKNLMHCKRLINVSLDIAKTGQLIVERPEREELLKIRYGKVNLEKILVEAEADIAKMKEEFKNSNLPEDVDHNFLNELLIKIRKKWYKI